MEPIEQGVFACGENEPTDGQSRRVATRGARNADIEGILALEPSYQTHDPAVVEKLERLDDLVFEAIGGNGESLDALKRFWSEVRDELDPPLLAESREQYLRYALTSWEQLAQRDGVRNPSMAIQALEVLSMLFGDAF